MNELEAGQVLEIHATDKGAKTILQPGHNLVVTSFFRQKKATFLSFGLKKDKK